MIPHGELIQIIGIQSVPNLSNILAKKQNIKPEAWEKFRNRFGIPEVQGHANGHQFPSDQLTGSNITLQDYIDKQDQRIDELKRDKELLYGIINSSFGRMFDLQKLATAYQKAWIEYEAERAAAGDQKKKLEIRYKMSKLVDDNLQDDTLFDIHVGRDKHHKA